MARTAAVACLLAVLVACAAAQKAPATAPAAAITSAAISPVAFAPTGSSKAGAPNPSTNYTATRAKPYASDDLANTPTSYNQLQTIGVFQSAHVAPATAIQKYLNTSAAQAALPLDADVPLATQYTQQQLYFQLEKIGARQFHFPIYYDPMGTLYQQNAGLKIANLSGNISAVDPKWTYPGWKVMSEPNFDWNTTCTTLSTCLYNIKNWILATPSPAPLTIYLEPTTYTYTSETGDNTTFADALASSNQTGGPDTLAEPLEIVGYQPLYQPWRDLENELLTVFDNNTYFSIVTPDDIMANDTDLASAVLQDGYTLYPALQDLKSRIFFVLAGNYTDDYLNFHPDLVNATMFISEPYNDAGNYTNSTLFVDVVGPLAGVNYTAFNATAAEAAATTQAAQVSKAVKAGYMVRASADWNTIEPRNNFTTRAMDMLSAGAHFVQTTFPSTPTFFRSTYSVALPIRGNVQESVRCNPVTSGGVIFNATALYTVGCPAVNSLTPSLAPAA